MVCIHCGAETRVINSRSQKRQNQVWRRRQCRGCGATFTTEETALYHMAWLVQSAQGDLGPFSRDKLLLSLHKSLAHRKTATTDAGALAETIIQKLRAQITDGRLSSRTIARVAQVALNRFDATASVHYAAFHAT